MGREISEPKFEKIKNQGYEKIYVKNGKLPVIMMNSYPAPQEFGNFQLDGEVDLFVKNNEKSKRVYLHALSDGMIKNKVLGDFPFKNNEMRELFFVTIGRNPILSRNNIWIARRNLSSVTKDSISKRIEYISENI